MALKIVFKVMVKQRVNVYLIAAKLDESYKYTKWRSQPEYLGCWGDWFDKPWGLSPRTRAMTRVNKSSLLTFVL